SERVSGRRKVTSSRLVGPDIRIAPSALLAHSASRARIFSVRKRAFGWPGRPSGRAPALHRPLVTVDCERQCEGEGRANPQLTLYPDSSAMQFNKFPRDGQAEPGTLHFFCRFPDLAEFFEHRLLILGRDTL